MKFLKFIIFVLALVFQLAHAQENVPVISEIVTDNANLFSNNEQLQLEKKLRDYELETTHQIVVLTINNLKNSSIEEYADRVFNAGGNKFGQAGKDNGLLILIAKNDRKFRIEVGQGFEPIITDAIASRILRNILTPAFKQDNYFEGVDEATTVLIKIIDDPIYAEEFTNTPDHEDAPVSLTVKFISALFLTPIFFLIGFFGYNRLIVKNKKERVPLKSLYLNNKRNFILLSALAICVVTYFNGIFWMLFFGLFVLGFLSVFVAIGTRVILHVVYKRTVALFKSLFTGKLGVFLFPFFLPVTLFMLVAGTVFTCMPIVMGLMFLFSIVFDENPATFLEDVDFATVLFAVIAALILFFVICALLALRQIFKSKKDRFGFSFFKFDRTIPSLGTGGSSSGSSRSYSSSGSSYSSSSRSSFSGGGGSSSGGGASGGW